MTASRHPGVDALAEHAEGLLEPAEAARVEEHVAACPECRSTVAALADVSAALAAAPDPGPVPELVAARIDRALREEAAGRAGERPAAVPVRRPAASARARARRALPGIVLAAAAVVGIGYAATAGLRGGTAEDSSAGAAAPGSAERDAGTDGAAEEGGQPVEATAGPGPAAEPPLVDAALLSDVARQAAAGRRLDTLGSGDDGGRRECGDATVAGAAGTVVGSFPARWDGREVVVVALRRGDGGGTALVLPSCGARAADALGRADVPAG